MLADLPEGWTVFRLPRSHYHCTLWSFEWESVTPVSLQEHVTGFLHQLQDGKSPHLLLVGEPGRGKTHISIGAYRVASVVFGTALVTWLNVPAFCEVVKEAYGRTDVDPWADVEEASKLVVLDDLFGRSLSQHETDHIVYRLIDTAYRNNAAVIATMNQPIEELRALIKPHEQSRLLADSKIIHVQAKKDWRR